MAFLETTLAMFEGREGQPAQAPDYLLALLELWRAPETIVRVTALLAQQSEGQALVDCLPPIPTGTARCQLRQRAALARTLGNGIPYVPFFPLSGCSPLQSSALSKVAERMCAMPMQVALA